MIKSIFALTALIVTTLPALAQDKLFLNDGSTIEGSVKQVSPSNVTYRRDDAPAGPDYVLNRKEVSRIVYEDGREEVLSTYSGKKENQSNTTYGRNIISFAPIQMTNMSAVGIGLQYERFLDEKGLFSLYIPIAVSFYEDNYTTSSQQNDRAFTYVYPGLKIYPGGSHRKVSYSIGASMELGFGRQSVTNDYYYGPYYGYLPYELVEEDVFNAGFLVNNGLNIQATKSFYLGLEVGIGVMYYSSSSRQYNETDEPMVQGQFKMGYRF